MKLFGQTLEGFAKALVILVAILLVSGGLCGLSLGIGGVGALNGANSAMGSLLLVTAFASGALIVLSLLGIVIVGIVWLISAAVRNSSQPSNVPPSIDANRNDDKEDRP